MGPAKYLKDGKIPPEKKKKNGPYHLLARGTHCYRNGWLVVKGKARMHSTGYTIAGGAPNR